MFGVELETEYFYLCSYDIKYAKDIFEGCCSDAEVLKFLNFKPYTNLQEYIPFMEGTIVKLKKEGNPDYRWVIVPKNNDSAIGIISANKYGEEYKLGYYLRKSAQGKGVMTEVMNHVIDYLFSIGVETVFSIHDTENIPSSKLMDKCGMKIVSTEEHHDIREDLKDRTMIKKSIQRNDRFNRT